MKSKILILAYMGTGKTELAKNNNNVVDLDLEALIEYGINLNERMK